MLLDSIISIECLQETCTQTTDEGFLLIYPYF